MNFTPFSFFCLNRPQQSYNIAVFEHDNYEYVEMGI